MTIEILVCRADGAQEIELRQVPEEWFDVTGPETPEE